jgi:hypothetical protein
VKYATLEDRLASESNIFQTGRISIRGWMSERFHIVRTTVRDCHLSAAIRRITRCQSELPDRLAASRPGIERATSGIISIAPSYALNGSEFCFALYTGCAAAATASEVHRGSGIQQRVTR